MFYRSFFLLLPFFFMACGDSDSEESSVPSIDMVDYYPTQDMSKSFLKTEQDKYNSTRKIYTKVITINQNKIKSKTSNEKEETIIFNLKNIQELGDINKTMKRFLSMGEEFYTLKIKTPLEDIMLGEILLGTKHKTSVKTCRLEEKMDKVNINGIPYENDILKFKCISDSKMVTNMEENIPDYITLRDSTVQNDYDVSYFYMKREVGLIALVNKDCMVIGGDFEMINDKLPICSNEVSKNEFFLN